jgi:hypothetical protein
VPRLAVTADLHHDVTRSRAPAEELAGRWPSTKADALLVVGDTATADGSLLEKALSKFADDGRPRLFVPGNHEIWTRLSPVPVERLLKQDLPRRVADAGWHWLPTQPYRLAGGWAVAGSLGWYDYAFAEPRLGLPTRFYEAKLSPAAAASLRGDDLRPGGSDVPDHARRFVARWNDGRFCRELDDDLAFCLARLGEFRRDLEAVRDAASVVAAVHVCPHVEMLPRVPDGPVPEEKLKYAFVRAYLGSPLFGDVAFAQPNVRHLVCGHSHIPRDLTRGGVRLLNVGSDYEVKHLHVLELPDRG